MHITLIRASSEIRWQMILHIDNLCHVLHLMAHSLSLMAVTSSTRSERANPICQILIFRCRTMTFQSIKIELIFIWSSTDRPLVYLVSNHSALISLLFIYHLSWISHLIVLSTDIHWVRLSSRMCWLIRILWGRCTRLTDLCIISSSLWSTFDLILNLCSLFFIWLSDWNSLANLLLLWPIKWVHLMVRSHH
jgi:hypothetical protein